MRHSHAQNVICNYSSLPFLSAPCLFLVWLIVHVMLILNRSYNFLLPKFLDKVRIFCLKEELKKKKVDYFPMHSSRGVLGRLRTHREIYLVECTYWYKEEFSLWISFLIDHCPDFEIGLQKCMTPQVASWGESRHLFTIHNYSDYHLVFFLYILTSKKNKSCTV